MVLEAKPFLNKKTLILTETNKEISGSIGVQRKFGRNTINVSLFQSVKICKDKRQVCS